MRNLPDNFCYRNGALTWGHCASYEIGEINGDWYAIMFVNNRMLAYDDHEEDGIYDLKDALWDYTYGYATGIDKQEVTNQFSLNIYPNPVSSETSIRFYNPTGNEPIIEVFNLYGQIVERIPLPRSVGANTYHWNTSKYSPGMYLIRLSIGPELQTIRTLILK